MTVDNDYVSYPESESCGHQTIIDSASPHQICGLLQHESQEDSRQLVSYPMRRNILGLFILCLKIGVSYWLTQYLLEWPALLLSLLLRQRQTMEPTIKESDASGF